MTKLTESFAAWCFKYHKDIVSLLMLGHVELLTEEMYQEYLDWMQTDEGKQYLKAETKDVP